MQMMNFANRGFGGPPQPQRQGGRRGNRGGGFHNNSRFDQDQPRNANSGGQRPSIGGAKPAQATEQPKPQQPSQPIQPKPVQDAQSKPAPQPAQQPKPQPSPQQGPQQQAKPLQQPAKPLQQPVQQQQQKPSPAQPQKNQSQENLNKSLEQKPNQGNQTQQQHQNQQQLHQNQQPPHQNQQPPHQNQQQHHQQQLQHHQQQQQQQKNFNGNFGANRGGGWTRDQGQAGPGNKQGGNRPFFNKQGIPGGPGGQGGPARNQQNRMSRGPHDGNPAMREEQMLANKLKDMTGPILDLPPIDQAEVKFNGRSRLYIGNLTNDVTEEEITKMFGEFGEFAELFLNKEKNFGFIKMDYRVNAERAKHALDGKMRNGKTLRVRFAPHNSAVRVKNLPPFVSNELLYRAFEIFGKIERAYVKVDERGRTVGEGVVEYVRKPSALAAIRNCTEKCFFLTSSLRPVIVESFEEPDELDGYPEKNLPKKHPEFLKARDVGPRFSEPGSFEHEYGTRWKQLHELHRQKEEALKKELASEEEKLEAQMEYAKYEHETELLREQLRQREQDRERQKRSWEMAERAAEERREAERAALARQEEELSQRMRLQDDELRRRQQENTLFVQAQRLNSMLDRQEQGMFEQQPADGGFRDQFDKARGGYDDSRGWEGPRQLDDYPNKRRRY